jgi:hypothetical protein
MDQLHIIGASGDETKSKCAFYSSTSKSVRGLENFAWVIEKRLKSRARPVKNWAVNADKEIRFH